MRHMKTLSMVLVLFWLGATVLAVSTASTKPTTSTQPTTSTKPAATTRPKIILQGSHAQMAKVCNLSLKQQKKILELRNLRRKRIKNFYKVHGKEMQQLKARIIEARRQGDKLEVDRIYEKLESLLAQRRRIDTKSRAEIMDVLTDEQKEQWYQYVIMRAIKRRFASAKLTDEQIAKIKAIVPQFTKGADISDKKVRYGIIRKLDEYIRKNILTDEQKKLTRAPARWKKRFTARSKPRASAGAQ